MDIVEAYDAFHDALATKTAWFHSETCQNWPADLRAWLDSHQIEHFDYEAFDIVDGSADMERIPAERVEHTINRIIYGTRAVTCNDVTADVFFPKALAWAAELFNAEFHSEVSY